MDESKEQAFSLVVEILMFVIALCVSIALGMLVAPWAGFFAFAFFAALFVVVLAASYRKAKREVDR